MKTKRRLRLAWTHHGDYFKLALDNWERVQKLQQEHDAIQASLKRKKKVTDDIANQLAAKNDAIGELAVVVIVFCAFTLEAYINDYAINRLSKNYLKNYLDRLNPVAKWVVIPRLVTRKQLDPGSRPVQDLSWLVELRNRLVHYKSKEVTIEEIKESDFLWYEDAERAVRAVKGIVSALKGIDRRAQTDWLG